MAKKKKLQQEFVAVVWVGPMAEESLLIVYNLTNKTSEKMFIETAKPEVKTLIKFSDTHSWADYQTLIEANNGRSVTVLDRWFE